MNINGEHVIAHLSDIHLGYQAGHKTTRQGINWREADGYVAFHECVNQIISDGTIDVAIIAGDLFHTPSPSMRSIIVARDELRRLSRSGIRVYSIAGNHDQSDIRAEIASSAVIDDRYHDIWSHAEPYALHEIFPDVWLHMVSHHLFSQQAATWDMVRPKHDGLNILTAHGTMMDPDTRAIIHSDAPAPREVIIPSEMIDDDWDKCMLGHIHERRFIGGGRKSYYNGSLIRRGFSDGVTDLGRGWTKWTIHNDGSITPEFLLVHQRDQYDLPVIDAKDISASEISNEVVDHIRMHIPDDVNDSNAPILRQRIINIPSSKKRSLDMPTISTWSVHALTWSLQTQTVEDVERERVERESGGGGSVADRYDSWLDGADAYQGVDDDMKDDVRVSTRDYIRKGLEEVLDDES